MTEKVSARDEGRGRLRTTALAGGICLVLWALGSALFYAPRVERKIASRARTALAVAGIPQGEVVVEGRRLEVRGTVASAELVRRARRALAEVPGARAVEVSLEVAPTTTGTPRDEPESEAFRPELQVPGPAAPTPGAETGEAAAPAAEAITAEPPAAEVQLDLQAELERLIGGRRIDFAKYGEQLTAEAEVVVDDVAEFLEDHRGVTLEIGGHTDSRGALERNLEISRRRAEAVRERLIAQGISGGRLRAVGFGPAAPIADNATEAGRRANRRVEFRIEERD